MNCLPEPKNNYEKAQRIIIGHLLNFPSSTEDIFSCTSKDDLQAFSSSILRQIFECMMKLHDQGTEITETLLIDLLRSHKYNSSSLYEILLECSHCAFREYQLKEIGDDVSDYIAALRGGYFLEIIKKRVQRASSFSEIISIAEEAIALDAGNCNNYQRPIGEIVEELIEIQTDIKENRREPGYSWGIPKLDDCIFIRPGKLYTVAAQKGAGKTKFLISILDHNLLNKPSPVPCLLFSLEMNDLEIIKYILSRRTAIDSSLIFSKALPMDMFDDIKFSSSDLSKAPFEIDSSPLLTIKEIISRIRHWKIKHKVPDNTGIVGIDFLQLVNLDRQGGRVSEATALKNTAYALAGAAKALKVSVIALAQLNKEADGKKPHIGYIEGSGGLAQASEGVLLLDLVKLREEKASRSKDGIDECNIIIAKNRDGESGVMVKCLADLSIGKFWVGDAAPAPELHLTRFQRSF